MLTTTEHGVEIIQDELPIGYVVIDVYHPHSTPWDYHGNRHQREMLNVLRAATISPVCLKERHRKLYPMGSGRNGSLRFGDDMMPGVYRIAVPENEEELAIKVIAQHKQEVSDWLDGKTGMPAAISA